MKRKFTFLIAAAVMLLTMVATTGTMWGQNRDSAGFTLASTTTVPLAANANPQTTTIEGSASETWDVEIIGNWTSSSMQGSNGAKYWQMGKNGSAITSAIFSTSEITGTISSIVVNCASYSSKAKVNCTIGGDNFGTQAQSTAAWANNSGGNVTFSGSASGDIVVTIDNSADGARAVYIQSITVTYSTGGGDTPSISADNVNLAYDATQVSIAYTLNNATGNVTATLTTGDWLTLGSVTESAVPFTCSANNGAQRTATVTLSFPEATDKVVTVTQAAAPNNISDITAVGTAYTVVGTVVATNNKGFVIGDGTGYVYTYLNASPSQAVGDKVKIAGTTGTYGQIIQFTNTATITSSTTSNYNGAPVATVITEVPDYSTGYHLSTYLEFEGALSKSSNNYFITLGESQIQISYPTTAQGTALTALDGKTVHVKGYFSGNNSSGYFSVMLESAEEVTNPAISINPETANPFTYVYGHGPSAEQVFEVTGTNLTSDDIVATITAGADYFEITDNEVYSNTVTVNSGDYISIRLKAGLALSNEYAGTLTLTNTGAENVVVNLTGSVTGATYTIEQYSTPEDAHGTITFAPASPVEEGTEVTLTATPAEGYDFTADSWVFYKEGASDFVVDPSITATDNKITMPAYNIWVDATFAAKPTYAITCVASPVEGGVILADPSSAYEGQTVTLSYVPETDYELTSIVITKTSDGSATGITPTASGNNYTFEMPGYAVTATATFVYNPNITYDFADVNKFYKESTLENHPETGSSNNIAEFYYKNGDSFTASGSSYYFSGTYFLLGKSGALVNLPTFTNYKITQIVIHSSTGHSTSVSVAIVSGSNTVASGQTWSTKDKDYTYNIPAAYQSSALSVKVTNAYNTQFTSITLVRELKPTDPEISVSTDAINNFSYNEGSGPSKKSFTVSGSNLGTTPISVELETGTNFGLALTENAENWNSSVTIDPTDGSVNNATVYVRMNAGLSEGAYNDNISVTWGNLSESVVLSGTVNPAPQDVTYTLITDINDLTPGYHYIIASEVFAGDLSIMGQQNTNNRAAVDATVNTGTITLTTTDGHYDFVISGDAGNNYTIYDEKNNGGFLYAASSSDNYLKTRESNSDGNSQWSIAIDNTGAATIIAQGSNTRKYLRYNANNNFFSCYAQNSTVTALTYLYKKTTDAPVYYSPTGVTVDNPDTDENPITVQNNEVLTITGTVSGNNPANLIIEDGGQVIVNNTGVQATFKKSVSHSAAKDAANWYTISSPVNNIAPGSVTNLIQVSEDDYDLYLYDEASTTWLNQKKAANSALFTNLTNGRGYLYWNKTGAELSFPGELNSGSVEIAVTKTGTGDLAGFNLIGNPYSHNIYKGAGTAIPNSKTEDYVLSTGFYTLSNEGAWTAGTDNSTAIKPGQGILVKATTAGTVTMTNTTANGAKRDNEFIKFIIANSQFEDVAYAMFNEEDGLNKINHRNASIPMLYIAQNEENYAIATMSEETQAFNLNFKAMTTGQYTLSFKAEGNYDYLHVIDRMTGEDVDMLLDGEYSFIASPSDNDARFIVKLGYNANNNAENDIFAYQNGNDIVVNGEGELQVFDMMGRMIATQHINGVQTVNMPSNGVYIFKLNEKTQKIVVR